MLSTFTNYYEEHIFNTEKNMLGYIPDKITSFAVYTKCWPWKW